MSQKILGIAGAKQSGKNTLSNWMHGIQLKINGIVDNFVITDEGDLVVQGLSVITQEGEGKQNVCLDVTQNNDYKFALWASDVMWPFIKNYSFAEALKEIAIDLFECPRHLVYGTDRDKNTVMEHLRWENMPGVITKEMFEEESGNMLCDWFPKDNEWGNDDMQDSLNRIGLQYRESGPMSIREFLQFLGTDVMRKMYEPVWVNRTLKDIVSENAGISVVSDCRFENEVKAIQKQGGKVVGLTRKPFSDGHASENSFNLENCDVVIDNQDQSIEDTCQEMFQILLDWKWLERKTTPKNRKGTMRINPEKEERNV